ncbi:MAG TPA: response regulator [Tepidisphaeraceae bacterium]|nr:response regulator [Tepidisphaeraceae bacterium]
MAVILIVDDNPDACVPLARLMRVLGHKGECVYSGEEALAFIEKNPVDLMILDMMMPGMDGLEVLRHVRSNPATAKLQVVMFSAISDPKFREHALQKGANDYWLKASLDFSQLQSRVGQFLNGPTA